MIVAYVNRGMWIAECQCKNAIALMPIAGAVIEDINWPQDTTVLHCRNCGLSSAVIMPVERDEIEALLIMRPEVSRNWWAHETIADLRLENAAHSKELI
jgi:hypothetical protein